MTDSRRGGRAPDSSYSLVFRRFHGAAFLSLDGTEQSDLAPAFLRFSPVLCPVPSSAVTPVVAIRAATVRRTEAMRPGRLSSWPKADGVSWGFEGIRWRRRGGGWRQGASFKRWRARCWRRTRNCWCLPTNAASFFTELRPSSSGVPIELCPVAH